MQIGSNMKTKFEFPAINFKNYNGFNGFLHHSYAYVVNSSIINNLNLKFEIS